MSLPVLKFIGVLLLFLPLAALQAEPTQERDWVSTAGSKFTAVATAVKNGVVTLESSDGRTLQVPLEKLSPEDQAFLKTHFKSAATASPPQGLSLPLGEFSGPISADSNSSYYIYLPKTMAEGIKPPVLFWTGSSPSDEKKALRFVPAAELAGIAIAVSVESRNQTDAFSINHAHTIDCLKHIEKTLPVDTDRAIFTGGSGGGATAFYNAHHLKCAGALPYIAYVPSGAQINPKAFYHIGGGARDFNRYGSAWAASEGGRRAIHRVYKGGHTRADETKTFEGVLWIYSRHLYAKSSRFKEEIELFEKRLLPWLKNLADETPHRAYFWTDHFLDTCSVKGSLQREIQTLHKTLKQSESNQRYLQAYQAVADFSLKFYTPIYEKSDQSHLKHVTEKITAAAKELEEEFSDVEEIAELARELGQPTGK